MKIKIRNLYEKVFELEVNPEELVIK